MRRDARSIGLCVLAGIGVIAVYVATQVGMREGESEPIGQQPAKAESSAPASVIRSAPKKEAINESPTRQTINSEPSGETPDTKTTSELSRREPSRRDLTSDQESAIHRALMPPELEQGFDGGELRPAGCSLAASKHTIAIGAPSFLSDAAQGGRVYVCERRDTTLLERRVLEGPEESSSFGASVDCTDSHVIVGAPFSPQCAGAAYIYHLVGSTPARRLTAPIEDGSPHFGFRVKLSGTVAAVSAPGATSEAYVAVYSNSDHASNDWSLLSAIRPPDMTTPGTFGARFDLSDDTIVVALAAANEHSDPGGICVYERESDNWSYVTTLKPDFGVPGQFGHSVAIHGDRIVVGAPEPDGGGRVYIFERFAGKWEFAGKLAPEAGGLFGWSIALRDELIVVGAPRPRIDRTIYRGQVFAFTKGRNGWTVQTRSAPWTRERGNFGSTIEIHGESYLASTWPFRIGSPLEMPLAGPESHAAVFVGLLSD